jgi:hypothetical protein
MRLMPGAVNPSPRGKARDVEVAMSSFLEMTALEQLDYLAELRERSWVTWLIELDARPLESFTIPGPRWPEYVHNALKYKDWK